MNSNTAIYLYTYIYPSLLKAMLPPPDLMDSHRLNSGGTGPLRCGRRHPPGPADGPGPHSGGFRRQWWHLGLFGRKVNDSLHQNQSKSHMAGQPRAIRGSPRTPTATGRRLKDNHSNNTYTYTHMHV